MNNDVTAHSRSAPTVLRGRVRTIKPLRAIVGLPDGTEAQLPAREWFADFAPHEDLRKRAKNLEGSELDVVEIEAPFGEGERVVSHVRVSNDPWNAVATWIDGDIKLMRVTACTANRAIGGIAPGVNAEVDLVALAEVLPDRLRSFGMPLPGDELAGRFRVSGIDAARRVVELDVAGYVAGPVSVRDILAHDSAAFLEFTNAPGTAYGAHSSQRLAATDIGAVRRILIIDNDRPVLVGVTKVLEACGCVVTACETLSDAMEAIRRRDADFDLAIPDVHLTGGNDYQGLDATLFLQEQQPTCPIVIVTGADFDRDSTVLAAYAELEVNAYLSRPFGLAELRIALEAVNFPRRPFLSLLPGASHSPVDSERDSTTQLTAMQELHQEAEVLRHNLAAEAVVLFSIESESFSVDIVAKADPLDLFSSVGARLDESPVRDVAMGRERVIGYDVRENRDDEGRRTDADECREYKAHRFLAKSYPYRSCVGVPVPVGAGSRVNYALFAFHRRHSTFNHHSIELAAHTARVIGCLLRIRQAQDEMRQIKAHEMMGKVYGSMAHDLTGNLSAEFIFGDLRTAIGSGETLGSLALLDQLEDRFQRAASVVTTFRSMARGIHEGVTAFSIDEFLPDIVRRFNLETLKDGVDVTIAEYSGPPCVVEMRKPGLEQIVYNLLLNASQQFADRQMAKLRKEKGQVVVELRHDTTDNNPCAVILVHDTASGIHGKDLVRVFDMYYTTKREGCGMGLDICRWIARSVKLGRRRGELCIKRSVLLTGTTFELQLPVRR